MHVRSSGLRAEGYLLHDQHPLVTAVSDAHERRPRAAPHRFVLGSTTDARTYVNDFATPALCFGPSAADIHGVDESVDLRSILDGATTLAHFLRAYWAGRGVADLLTPDEALGLGAATALSDPFARRITVGGAADAVTDRLVTAVALGIYVPGQRLPPERELSGMLEVSRTTVREGLQRLVADVYLEVRRGRSGGYFVLSRVGPELADIVRRSIAPRIEAFEALFDARRLIEGLIASTAAARRSEDDLPPCAPPRPTTAARSTEKPPGPPTPASTARGHGGGQPAAAGPEPADACPGQPQPRRGALHRDRAPDRRRPARRTSSRPSPTPTPSGHGPSPASTSG